MGGAVLIPQMKCPNLQVCLLTFDSSAASSPLQEISLPGASAARCIGLPVILARGGMDVWARSIRGAGKRSLAGGCLAGALASRRVDLWTSDEDATLTDRIEAAALN